MIVKTDNILLPSPTRPQITELVRRWGNSASICLLDPACQYFTVPELDGVIGYRAKYKCAVAYGDPVCAPHNTSKLAEAFQSYCQKQGWRTIYISASNEFTSWALNNICQASMKIGEEFIFNPQHDPLKGSAARNLRNKISHAERFGVHVNEYLSDNDQLKRDIEQVAETWQKGRKGPQIYFADVNLFEEPTGKRWFYARNGNGIIGVLLLNQLEAEQGWLINLILTTPDAPNGTSEMLVVSVLQALKEENCQFTTVGTLPTRHLDNLEGFGKISTWFILKVFQAIKGYFPLDSRTQYWKKFPPRKIKNLHVIFSHSLISPRMLLSIFNALNASVK